MDALVSAHMSSLLFFSPVSGKRLPPGFGKEGLGSLIQKEFRVTIGVRIHVSMYPITLSVGSLRGHCVCVCVHA